MKVGTIIQWTGMNQKEIVSFCADLVKYNRPFAPSYIEFGGGDTGKECVIFTEGRMDCAYPGDYIARVATGFLVLTKPIR